MESYWEYGWDLGEGLFPSRVEAVTGNASVMSGHVGWVSETGIATCVTCGVEPVTIDGDFYDDGQRILNPCECSQCFGDPEPEVHTFLCPNCRRLVPWDQGCADDKVDLCDECWDKERVLEERDARVLADVERELSDLHKLRGEIASDISDLQQRACDVANEQTRIRKAVEDERWYDLEGTLDDEDIESLCNISIAK